LLVGIALAGPALGATWALRAEASEAVSPVKPGRRDSLPDSFDISNAVPRFVRFEAQIAIHGSGAAVISRLLPLALPLLPSGLWLQPLGRSAPWEESCFAGCFARRRRRSRADPRAPRAAEGGVVAEYSFALSFVENFVEANIAVTKAGKRT
jgi:hypothetical protein